MAQQGQEMRGETQNREEGGRERTCTAGSDCRAHGWPWLAGLGCPWLCSACACSPRPASFCGPRALCVVAWLYVLCSSLVPLVSAGIPASQDLHNPCAPALPGAATPKCPRVAFSETLSLGRWSCPKGTGTLSIERVAVKAGNACSFKVAVEQINYKNSQVTVSEVAGSSSSGEFLFEHKNVMEQGLLLEGAKDVSLALRCTNWFGGCEQVGWDVRIRCGQHTRTHRAPLSRSLSCVAPSSRAVRCSCAVLSAYVCCCSSLCCMWGARAAPCGRVVVSASGVR